MVDQDIEFKSSGATSGGFQAIKMFEGNLVEHRKIPNKFAKEGDEKPAPDQIEVFFEDVVILEMADGEPEPELRDNKYSILFNYALPGRKPHKNSKWTAGYVKSAEALGKTPKELEGTRAVMEQKDVELFKQKNKETGAEEPVIVKCYTFVNPNGVTGVDLDAKVQSLIAGKAVPQAYREVMIDNFVKRHSEITDAVQRGEPVSGMEVKDGVYQKAA